MSESKKPADKRIIDVARPGKSAAPATSKPVIITNRPILKDPMMAEEEAQAAEPATDKVKITREPKLKPIDISAGSSSDSQETAPLLPVADADKNTAPSPATEPVKKEEKKTDETPAVPVATSKPIDIKEPEAKTETPPVSKTIEPKEAPSPPAPSPSLEKTEDKTTEEESAANDTNESTESQTPVKPEGDLEAQAAEKAKHDAAIEQLVESKKYYLPINTIEKRRTKRFVILGVLLSLLLAAAWADIALDAGLIQIPGAKPLTHFFSN